MNLPTYVSGTVQAKGYRVLREHVYDVLGQYDITPTHWSMMGIILQARNGVRQAEVANAVHVKAPLVTVMSRDLQRRELIQSVTNQFDVRAKLLAVTPKGKKFMKTVETALNKRLDKLLVGLTQDDLITYHKVLTTIITNDSELRKQ